MMSEAVADEVRHTLNGGAGALEIVQADAARVYRDLSRYCVRVALEEDGWHVDYSLKDLTLKGGGPHYIIDPGTGAITHRRYEQ
jgi:hypothetical protein